MDNLLKKVIEEKMQDGAVERIMAEKFEQAIKSAVDEMFRYNGDGKKMIEAKLQEVMIPAIEKHDFNRYLIKLNVLLLDIAKEMHMPEYYLLANTFGELLKRPWGKGEVVTLTRLAEVYKEYVADNVDVDGLDIDYDDEVTYEAVGISVNFVEDERPDWSIFDKAHISFECEHDEKLNYCLELSRHSKSDEEWNSCIVRTSTTIESISSMNCFEIVLNHLNHANCKIQIDEYEYDDCVMPTERPEARYN